MVLPLPKVVADVEAGGPFATTMRGLNALTEQNLKAHQMRLENKYYPQKTMAQVASQLAYSNLVGPQYLAKLFQNPDFLANIPDDQKENIMKLVTNAGINQSHINNAIMQPVPGGNIQQPTFQSPPPTQVPLSNNALNKNNQRGYDEPMPKDNQDLINRAAPGNTYIPDINAAYQNKLSRPQVPETKPSFAENVGGYKGTIEEGKESGKIRAQEIKDLNDTYFNAQTNQSTLDDVSSILSSPEFEQIRQTPLLGHHELSYYAKFGTPAQQDMVGKYYTLTGNIIKDSARDFAGAFRRGEQQLLTGMKPNPGDTVNAARGKVEALSVMNRLLAERSRLTSQIMRQNHVDKLQATEMADKQINGEEIRKEIHDKLNPKITIKNKKTGEQKTISVSEARKLGVPNV